MFQLFSIIAACADVYSTILFVYVLMSWVPMGEGLFADIYASLGKICEPYLQLFRRFIPPLGGMIDVSPIVALIALQLGVRLLYRIFFI